MKKMKSIVAKLSAIVPAMALLIGVMSANSACVIFYHQPEVPSGMDAYRR